VAGVGGETTLEVEEGKVRHPFFFVLAQIYRKILDLLCQVAQLEGSLLALLVEYFVYFVGDKLASASKMD
jgi:hypothetical protein